MANISKAVILDVDGVVFCHRPTLQKINTRIQHYVARTARISESHAPNVNESLYKQFGHTFIGLQKVYGVKTDLKAFNDYVYTHELVQSVHNATYNVDVLHHLIDLQSFLQQCVEKEVPIYLFSNAPYSWCKQIHHAFNLNHWIPTDRIITCDHDVFQSQLQALKPQMAVYKTLQTYLTYQHQNPDLRILYIDDSLANLTPVMDAPRWSTVLYGADQPQFNCSKLIQVSGFKELQI